MTTRTFRPYEPDDLWLLPPSPQEWLPTDHLAYFVSDLVEELDLRPILQTYGGVTRGAAPYHPRLLVKVLLYAYAVGVAASRQMARELEENVAFRVLAANQRPDFRTLSDFRTQHLAALTALFVQVLRLCQRAGLVKLGHIALDGTKLQANASKHKAMSYDRMVKEETRLQAEVERCSSRRRQPMPAMMPRMGRIGAAMNCRLNWPVGSSGLRPFGLPRRSWNTRRKRRPR
jgi:transposase